jgi:hypothetical protein
LPPRSDTALDAKVPQDSTLAWRLHFDAEPQAAHLAFHDGSRVDLHHDGGDWMGERTLAASSLYRIELDGALPLGDDLHRIDVVADRAPRFASSCRTRPCPNTTARRKPGRSNSKRTTTTASPRPNFR